MATQACSELTKGLEASGPNIIFMRLLSAMSKDPDPKVMSTNTGKKSLT